MRDLDLNEILRRVAELLGPQAASQGIEIILELREDPLMVHADPDQLQQVFLNLIAAGITPQRLYDKCEKLFLCWRWSSDNLDNVVTQSERTSKNDVYFVWVRDCAEADEEFKNHSADVIKSKNITTETFEERCIHELKYFRETGEHLDMENITLCAGSRYSNGEVPSVRWVSGMFRIRSARPNRAGRELRSRRVIS